MFIKLFSLISISLLTCTSTRKMTSNESVQKNSQTAFDKEGHRGCRGLMPENTVDAMTNALGMGITTLEMDVVITKDKKVILSHEPFFNHEITTKPDGSFVTEAEERSLNIFQMDYETVKKYDVGLKPHPRFPKQEKRNAIKPLLSDVFDAVKSYMMTARRPYPYFNIETKSLPETDGSYHPAPAEFVELLMQIINEKQLTEQVIIQSFDVRTLQYLHKNYPAIKTSLLIEGTDQQSFSEQLNKLGFTPDVYSPEYTIVNAGLIKACHDKGMKIVPWTVNEKTDIEKLTAAGVDGIITDYPDLF
jgi:glycerophosphoryl diester phosphodiesterase